MFKYTILALVCLVQVAAATGYGNNNNGNVFAPPYNVYVSDDSDSEHDSSSEERDSSDESDSSDGYDSNEYGSNSGYGDDQNNGICDSVKQLHISGVQSDRAHITEFTRKGETFLKISCRNYREPFALVAQKSGINTAFETANLPNTVLLATGFNVDFIAKCRHGKRVIGKAATGEKHSIRRVTCVRLSAPSDITAL